jgi:murein L,D-transpeptidase YcbB/YkuD
MQGFAVKALQKQLAQQGVYPQDRCNGIFDHAVEQAVKLYQHRLFLKADGVVEELTWQALQTGSPTHMPPLMRGCGNIAVVILQRVLQITGDYLTSIDGEFGLNTEQAVRSFQEKQGLAVDGFVNLQTWYALSRVPH